MNSSLGMGVLVTALVVASALGAQADDQSKAQLQVNTAPLRHPGTGIWKAVVPPTNMKGEFDGYDPIGLAAGTKIKADCSINWVDPDDGRLYCFASATSQSYFQDWPKHNIARAQAFWSKVSLPGS
ncbi:MAG: hypothetical protein WC829_02480 [Hyphomicrobium sp.]|jgi:hypothetical protein